MTLSKTQLRIYSMKFLKNSLIICKKFEDQLVTDEILIPTFFKNGQYNKAEKKSFPDYDYFVKRTIKNELTTLSDYDLLTIFLKEPEIQKYNQKYSHRTINDEESNVPDLTTEFPKKFLIEYLKTNGTFEYNQNVFSSVFQSYFKFLQNILIDEYIIPLHNFQSDLDEKGIKIGDITIRKINSDEFRLITKLDLEYNRQISSDYHHLTHVLVSSFESDDNADGYKEIEKKSQKLINALRIYFSGNLQHGSIYKNINTPWKPFASLYDENFIKKDNRLKFLKIDVNGFKKFYSSFKNVDLELSENLFLKQAINRYAIAIHRNDPLDVIVDLVISIESLYSSGSGDTTIKISNRICTLLSNNDKDREYLWKFMKSVYKFRSGIVHGAGNRPVIIDEKNLTSIEISDYLSRLTRESIAKFLKITTKYSGSEKLKKVFDELDVGLINRKKLKEFKKKNLL